MHKIAIALIIIFVANTTYGEGIYYYPRLPDVLKSGDSSCDHNIRSNANSFKNDMKDLLSEYKESNWEAANTNLAKYMKNNDYHTLEENNLIKSIVDCGNYYKFNDKNEYFRDLYSVTMMFLMDINISIRKRKQITGDVVNKYESIINNINTIISSTNKSANNTLNMDAQKSRAY